MSNEMSLADRRMIVETATTNRRKLLDEACKNYQHSGTMILVPYSTEASTKAEAFELLASTINSDIRYLNDKGFKGSYSFIAGPEFTAIGINGVLECALMLPLYIHRPLS